MKNEESKRIKSQNLLDERAAATNIDSLSDVALQKFIQESKRKYKHTSEQFLQELREMDLLEYDEKSTAYLPTGNAILLFGKNPRNKFPQAGIKAKVHYADGKIGAETFDDALVLLPDQVEDWLRKVLPSSIDRTKFKAKQVPAFPTEVVREAIINALAHRDYSKDGAKIQLEVFTDRIVVKSPGEPIPPITLEAMRNFTATSYSRNKKLSFIYNEMDYMEETALGMDTFKSVKAKYNLPLPIIEYDGLNVVVSFPRSFEAIKDASHNKAVKELTNAQLQGYELIRLKGEISTRQYSAHFDIGYKTAQRHLTRMRELKLIGDNGESINSPRYRYIIL